MGCRAELIVFFSSVNLQYCRPDVKCVAFDTVCYVVSSTSARIYHQELVKMLHNAGDKYRYGEHPGNNLGLYQLSDSIKTLIALAVYFFFLGISSGLPT